MKFLATLLIAATLVWSPWKFITAPAPIQQSATHRIIFLDKDGDRDGTCTATAIGPHAILTAAHCNDDDKDQSVNLDLSTYTYNLVAAAHDGRDHVIYLIDGPAFKNIVDVQEEVATAGESVYMYGDGAGQFPPRELTGSVQGVFDPSDVDAEQGLTYFSLEVTPGDSGSAVYTKDGHLVALVTYSVRGHGFFAVHEAAGFALNFTQPQIDYARCWQGVKGE